MSERITWTTCPRCTRAAAVGWQEDVAIEFYCSAGCTLADIGVLLLDGGRLDGPARSAEGDRRSL